MRRPTLILVVALAWLSACGPTRSQMRSSPIGTGAGVHLQFDSPVTAEGAADVDVPSENVIFAQHIAP